MVEFDETVTGLAAVVARPRVRELLERGASKHRSSAGVLRARGKLDAARRAEQAASRIRLMLEDPRSVERMHARSRVLAGFSDTGAVLERALEGALDLMQADLGNIQVCDPADGTLRIAVESGFSQEFLEYFARVDDESSACGRSASQQSQTVIADVREDAAFAPHRAVAAASGFRAVQSTPLVDRAGRLIGVVSTHYRRPHRPNPRELQLVSWFGEHVATVLAEDGCADGHTNHGGSHRSALARKPRER